jgi:hypothetical protein
MQGALLPPLPRPCSRFNLVVASRVTACRHCVGRGEIRLELNGTIEEMTSLHFGAPRRLDNPCQAPQIAIVGIEIFDRLASGPVDLGLFQFWCNRADHARCHPILKLEDVFENAVKMIRPQNGDRFQADGLPEFVPPAAVDSRSFGSTRVDYRPRVKRARRELARGA